jgi:hypothetical protein
VALAQAEKAAQVFCRILGIAEETFKRW